MITIHARCILQIVLVLLNFRSTNPRRLTFKCISIHLSLCGAVMCVRLFHFSNVMVIPRKCFNIHHKTSSIQFGYQCHFLLISCNKLDVVVNVSYIKRYTFLAQAYDIYSMVLQWIIINIILSYSSKYSQWRPIKLW